MLLFPKIHHFVPPRAWAALRRVVKTVPWSHGSAAVEPDALLPGATVVFARRGYGTTSLAEIAADTGVRRKDLELAFASKEECFLAVYRHNVALARQRIFAAVPGGLSWAEEVRQAIAAASRLLLLDPPAARILLLEARSAGTRARRLHRENLEEVAAWLRRERSPSAPGTEAVDDLQTATGLACLLADRLDAGTERGEERFVDELTHLALAPSLGRTGR